MDLFQVSSCYYVNFRTNIPGKGMNSLSPLSFGLNNTPTVVLQR